MSAPVPPPHRPATAERLARMESLFHAALDQAPDQRDAFLRRLCGDDVSLLIDVQSLLRADGQSRAPGFEAWAGAVAAARAVDFRGDPSARLAGRALSHYDIVECIGTGGMGEVYLARDCVLGRQVALKILPAEVAHDPRRLERFHLEARAASALTHPNVAAVYELGTSDATPFIAMEYVEGRTLDAIARDGPMALHAALDAVLQILAALAAAHEAGITHRDVKPGNVILTPRGVVKVLDFGLAKLTDTEPAGGTAASRRQMSATTPGLVLGTINYMSPEQALGRTVDHRSDLFSAGVVLYQLSTGALPFRGDTDTATIDNILHANPPPPSSVRPSLPRSLDRVLACALAKSPEQRYQSAIGMSADLEAVRQGRRPAAAAEPGRTLFVNTRVVASTAVVIAAAAAVWGLRLPPPTPALVVPFTSFAGIEATPAFSPDGSLLAFSWDGPARDNVDVYIKSLGGSVVRLTSDPGSDQFPAFSPDGRLVAFVRNRTQLFVVPTEGGAEREVGSVLDPRIAFAPDGRFIAAGGAASAAKAAIGITLVPLAGGTPRMLTTPPPGSTDIAPAFSPDGRQLAFQRIPTPAVADIWVADADGSHARRITFDDRFVEGPVWTEDGRDLIFSSSRLGAGRLWGVPAAGGTPQPLPDTGPGSTAPTVPRRGDRLAFVASLEDTNLWELPLASDGSAAGPAQPSPSSSSWLDGSPDFSADGRRLVFVSNRTGRDEIYVSDADGVTARQLTDFSQVPASTVGSPRFSPDGTRVAFDARVRGNADIYVVAVSGGPPRRLTDDPGADVVPIWSPDGAWIYFTSRRGGVPQIWRMRQDGSASERVTDTGAFGAQFSPDGRFLIYGRERANTPLWRRPVAGGREEPVLGDGHAVVQFAFWRPTRDGIIYVERQPSAPGATPRFLLQAHDVATARTTTLDELATPPALASGGLAISPDGRRVLVTRLDAQRGDINLLQPYR